jgi:cephalosporin hydroxylase|tara:strand:+ start:4497 stop:5228 length:732 start_codon:yes stop_codon:yes gene_type:complete
MKDKKFDERNKKFEKTMSKDVEFKKLSQRWFDISLIKYEYPYHFTWLGRPIIQYPQDILIIQELIWKIKPDLVIETGIARGGSLIFTASILELIGKGNVIGIDVDIRKHNREEIEKHPMFKRIKMIEGSSIDKKIVKKIFKLAERKKKILVLLDSSHTHSHVLEELKSYSPLVNKGSYVVVFDTVLEDMPKNSFPNRPWDKGDNPKTAVKEFVKKSNRFKIDVDIERKLMITSNPSGFLKCVK